MSVELKYSEECTDKDTPALCIPSLRRGTSSNNLANDAVRGVPVEQPSRMLSIRVANANDKVAGKRDIVKEVYPYQETMTYSRESKHKLVGGLKDYIVTNDDDGLVLDITEQTDSVNN